MKYLSAFYTKSYEFIYAFLILLMYFLAGISKAVNFSSTVKGFHDMFFLQNLPKMFYDLVISGVVLLEIIAPIVIMFSLYTNNYTFGHLSSHKI